MPTLPAGFVADEPTLPEGFIPDEPTGDTKLADVLNTPSPIFPGTSGVVRSALPGVLQPENLLPAVRKVGGVTVTGEIGDTHADIIAREGIPAVEIDQRGFIGPQGLFYDRESAAKASLLPTGFEPDRLHSTDLPSFEKPLAVTPTGPIFKSDLEAKFAPPEPSIYEKPTQVEEAVAPIISKVTTPLHKFTGPSRDTIEKALMLPFQAAADRLEMLPDYEDHPVLEKLASMAPTDKTIDAVHGVSQSVAESASFFTSPLGIALLATGGLPAATQRAVALAFAIDMGRTVPDMAKRLGELYAVPEDQRDYKEIAKLVTDAITATGFSALSAAHGLKAGPDLPIPRSREWEGPMRSGREMPPPDTREALFPQRPLPPLPRAEVPEGPPPQPQDVMRPPRKRPTLELGKGWEDFVADMRRRGRADMTIREVQQLFAEDRPGRGLRMQMNREAARKLRNEAFPPEEPTAGAPVEPAPGEPPPAPKTPPDIAKALGGEAGQTFDGKDHYVFPPVKAGASRDMVIVPEGSSIDVVRAQLEKARARWADEPTPGADWEKQFESLPPPPKTSSIRILIRGADGKTYPAYAESGWQELAPGTEPKLWVSRLKPGAGGWSTGFLAPGETIEAGNVPPKPTPKPAPAPAPKPKVKRSFYIRPRPDGAPDILDAIQEIGYLAPLDSKIYGNWRDHIRGVAQAIIRKGGTPADKMVEELNGKHLRPGQQSRTGQVFRIESVDDLIQMIGQAVRAREGFKEAGGDADMRADRFVSAVDPPNKKGLIRKNMQELKVGDKFTLRGYPSEEFTVTHLDPDTGTLQVKGGPSFGVQDIPDGAEIWVDAKTFKPAPESVDFLPPEEPGGEMPKQGWQTPVIPGQEAVAESQSAGLPKGTFYALDKPFESDAHDARQAKIVPIPKVKQVYDPDGLIGKASPNLHEAFARLENQTKAPAEGYRDRFTEYLRSRGYDAYVRGIDGNPKNRELIVFEKPEPSPHPKMDEIAKAWPQLSPAEADIFAYAIDAARAKLKDYSSPAEALQKEALRIAAPREGIKLTRIGDLKLAKEIAEKYLQPEPPTRDPGSVHSPYAETPRPLLDALAEHIKRNKLGPSAVSTEGDVRIRVPYPKMKPESQFEQNFIELSVRPDGSMYILGYDIYWASTMPKKGLEKAIKAALTLGDRGEAGPAPKPAPPPVAKPPYRNDAFNKALSMESVGGTAGEGKAGVNFLFDKTGEVAFWGNWQNAPEVIKNSLMAGELEQGWVRVADALGNRPVIDAVSKNAPKEIQDLIGRRVDRTREGPPSAPGPSPEPPPPKPTFTPAEQARIDELLKDIKNRLRGGGGMASTLIPGIDPELFNKGGELAYLYLKGGVRKFADFSRSMIEALGDAVRPYLLSWYNNARLQLKDIAHELDPEATAQAYYDEHYAKRVEGRPAVPRPVRGSLTERGRPGIRISRDELIPEPRQHVNANSYAARSNFRLDEQQVRGVNLMLDRFLRSPQRSAFVLADGTGFGKTAQLLALADQYIRKGLGKRVLIVTENKTVANVRFGGDADRMGIDPKSYTITTYTSIGKVPPGQWDLVIFDEAHNLKNSDAQKSIKAARLDSKHTVFATATPMDRPTGAAYFLAEVTGKTEQQIAHDLGYQIVQREDPITKELYDSAVLLPTMTWQKVWANIMAHRDAAISAGSMIRREYPFYGSVSVEPLEMSVARRAEHNAIARYWDSRVAAAKNPTARRNYGGQKTLELGRWAEQAKIDDAVKMAVEHIKAGGQAIIVAETDKEQSFSQPVADSRPSIRVSPTTGKPREVWLTDGAITKLKKLLAAEGITDIADIHDPKSHDIPLQVREFQAGRKRVALATPQSGGTGIDLDDVVGNRPRLMIALSKNMAGDRFEQLVGRVSRKNTASEARVKFLDLKGSYGDERRNLILGTKIKTLKAIQGGEELDVAGGFRGEAKPGRGEGETLADAPVQGTQAHVQGLSPKELQDLLDQADPNKGMMYSGIPIPGILHAFDYTMRDLWERIPEIRKYWRSFSMQSLPRITDSNREAGEAGVRLAAATMVARAKGLQFAEDVTRGVRDRDFDKKFGAGLTEDNLRDLRRVWNERADEAENRHELIDDLREQIAEIRDMAEDDPTVAEDIRRMRKEIRRLQALTDADVEIFRRNAENVTTMIGADNSPFQSEAQYRAFMEHPETQTAIRRHIQLWERDKDPIYRQAADIDPEIELETRGMDYGARVNLKNVLRDTATPTTVGPAVRSPLIRATATLRRQDPFALPAMGAGSYEASYREIMANGFGREYPIAKQHEFIRKLLEAGDAQIATKEFVPGLEIRGESTKGYPLKLRPWANRWLQIRKSMAPEYEDAAGLSAQARLGLYTPAANFLTRMSVQGLAEGSTHVSNLMMQVFTGLGPTGNPMLNALLKSAGRADVLVSVPKVLINAFADRKADMLALAEIGAAKEPYRGGVGWFITKIDHGVRLYSADVYKKLARAGYVPDTETGLREYVNQVGQYNKRLQPRWIQYLRSTGIQPFATAMQTFNVQGLRTLAMRPGVQAESKMASVALHADKAANILGFAVAVTALNYLISGTATGPAGTKLGAVGWIGDDKKLHQLDLGALTGISRGFRITGLQGYIEAKRLKLGTGEAVAAGARGAFNTAFSAATGPMNRAIFMSATGKRPGLPPVQEAPVVPPQDERRMNLIKTQTAQNIIEAAKQANPIVDAIIRLKQGKYEEALTRQLSRYTPRTGMRTETIQALPRIIQAGQLNDYAAALAREARKMPLGAERSKFIMDRLKEEVPDATLRAKAFQELRRKGAFTR